MKDAKVIHELKDYLKSSVPSLSIIHESPGYIDNLSYMWCFSFWYSGANADIHVIPKIESADSIPNLQSIIAASDGV